MHEQIVQSLIRPLLRGRSQEQSDQGLYYLLFDQYHIPQKEVKWSRSDYRIGLAMR